MSKAGINRNLPNDAYEAATNANAPSALNPFVTEVDAAVSAASLILYPTTAASVIPTYNHLVNSLTDPDYDDPAVDLSTGAITGAAQLIASLASDEGVISGNPGTVNVNTIGNIRRASGSGTATFYFEIYHRDNLGTETLLGTSNTTYDATSAVYEQFFASALITGIEFTATDRVVTKWYANRVAGGSNPTYEIQIGGDTPVKVTFPVPLSSLPTTNSFETVGKSPDIGFTWGTNDVVADSPTDTLKLVEGTNITIETDDVNDGIRISSTGGSAGTADSSGVLTGGVLSVGTGGPGVATTFSISDGTGQIVDATGAKTPVSWSGLTDQALTFLATNLISFIAIDSGGSVIQSTTKFTPQQSRQYIVLGVIVHVNFTTVDTVNNEQEIAYNVMSSVYDGFESLGFFNVSGNVFSANGANMNINKSVGVMFKMGSNYDADINNPHRRTLAALTPAQFQYRFSDGTSGILTETNIDPNNLDDGAGGLTAISANRWSVQRIYSFTSNNVKIQRGVAEYATSDAAISGITTEAYVTEPSIAANGLFRGWLIVKQGATALNGSDAIFLSAGKLGEQGTSGGGAGAGATDLQIAYDNSIANPEILTNNTNGAHTVRRGSAADTDNIYEGKNGAGTTTFGVTGEGKVSAADFNGVALTTGGVTTKYLDEQGNYTTPGGGGTSKFNHTTYAFDFVGASGTWNGNTIGAVGSTEYDDRWRVVSFAGTGQADGFYLNFRLSSEYTAGTDIRVAFDFATLVGSGGGNAHFGVGLCEPETINNSFGSEATTTYITQDIAVQPGDRIATYSAVFSGTNLEPGDQLSIMVYRDPGNAGDTNNETLYVSTIIAEEV